MEFTWLLILCGLVVIPVVFISEQGHENGLIGTSRIEGMREGMSVEPGGILFGPI